MKIIFVSSGNRLGSVSPIVKAQGKSIEEAGHEVSYFLVKGKGIFGYVSNIIPLRRHLNNTKYDIVHAHFSYCGYVTLLAGGRPNVLSLMGSDLNSKKYNKYILRIFCKFFNASIVKSIQMKSALGLKSSHIIPNGVNLEVFKPIERDLALGKLGWSKDRKHILFAANPDRPEKNFQLASNALNLLSSHYDLELHTLSNISHEEIPCIMSASDVVILTSKWEGSPNVIKEAMACNRPIVSTDVGDVKYLLGDVDGCFLTLFDADDLKTKIQNALLYSERFWLTKGRERIKNIGYDSSVVVEKLINLYNSILC